jgi:hypothetical protein
MSKRPDYSVPPKSSWHSRLKEHKGVLGGITVHPGGENLELAYLPRVSCMCCQILDHSCKDAATPSLMPTRVEHSGQRHDRWLTEAVCNIVGASLLVLNVQMELLQVCGPFLMAIVLQLPLCLYELHRVDGLCG